MKTKLRVFIGSSSEAENVMRSLEAQLSNRGFIPVAWPGSFGLAQNTLSELWRLAHEVDFAVFVWAADSILEERGHRAWTTRDNVIYEAGLFAGVLSPSRVFLVVKADSDVKIPSDYLGIGYASWEKADYEGVQTAAIEIQKAIDRVEHEMTRDDLTREIEGFWTDATVNRGEQSVVSMFELRRRGPGVLDIVNGQGWDPDGELRSRFWSTSSNFVAATNTLTYSWQGVHPRESVISEHFGVGVLEFDPDHPSFATGRFSASPSAALEKTSWISHNCRKPAASDVADLRSDNRKTREEAVKRLLRWREDIR